MTELEKLENILVETDPEKKQDSQSNGAEYSKKWSAGLIKYLDSGSKPAELVDLSKFYPSYRKLLLNLDLSNNDVARQAFVLGTMRSVFDTMQVLDDEVDVPELKVIRGQKHLHTVLKLLEAKDRTPTDIASETGLKGNNVSYVLKSIQEHGLIDFKMYGKTKQYYLTTKGRRFLRAQSRTTSISVRQYQARVESAFVFLTAALSTDSMRPEEIESGLIEIIDTSYNRSKLTIIVKTLANTITETKSRFRVQFSTKMFGHRPKEIKAAISDEDPDSAPLGPGEPDKRIMNYTW